MSVDFHQSATKVLSDRITLTKEVLLHEEIWIPLGETRAISRRECLYSGLENSFIAARFANEPDYEEFSVWAGEAADWLSHTLANHRLLTGNESVALFQSNLNRFLKFACFKTIARAEKIQVWSLPLEEVNLRLGAA